MKKTYKIYIVGIGPGNYQNMTESALSAIQESDVIVGYTYYIELVKNIIKDKIKNKEIFSSSMGQEVQRCQKALEYALDEKIVSVISSGDSGIYGMAGIMYEVCKNYPDVEVIVIPGITACCCGAAILGAPLVSDFAVISLSDLLTPWSKIQKRLLLASEADFVICIYNPSSKNRASYLKKACDIMLNYKDKDTPCGYVKNIARENQSYNIITLENLKDFQADMFTTIFIGNSQTKVINGKLVTSRGYRNI